MRNSVHTAVREPLPPLYLERHRAVVAPWKRGRVLADRAHPERLRRRKDIGFHLHPLAVSQLGYVFFVGGGSFLCNLVGVSRWVCAGDHGGQRCQIPRSHVIDIGAGNLTQ